MKMNKNKTMLALVLVATLAICTVVAIANAQESDAEDISYSFLDGDYTVKSTDSNIFIYGGMAATITVPATVTYSGTISFGYYNPNGGFHVATDSIVISEASDLKIVYDVTNEIIKLSGNYTGDVTLAAGSVMVGPEYSGSIIAGDAKFENDKTTGLVITLKDGKACMSGEIKTGKVTVTGNAFIDAVAGVILNYGITLDSDAELVIASDAKVDTLPLSKTTYDVTFNVDKDLAGTTPTVDGRSMAVSGKKITATGLNAGMHTFEVGFIQGTLIVLDNGKWYVNSAYSVETCKNAVATYDLEDDTYIVTIETNVSGNGMLPHIGMDLGSVSNGTITFKIPTDKLDSAEKYTSGMSVAYNGTIYTGDISLVGKVSTNGAYSDGYYTVTLDQSVADQSKTAKSTTVYNENLADSVVNSITGKLTIDGTLNVTKVYSEVKSNGTVTKYYKYTDLAYGTTGVVSGEISVNGLMTYQNVGPLATGNLQILTNLTNATAYYVENTSTSATNVVNYTYYFTTFANALSNASSVTVYGKQVIDSDMTLETGVAGADETNIDVIGELNIGVKADPTATPAVEGKTVVVTVPEDTTNIDFAGIVSLSSYYGGAVVQNGQLRFAGLEVDSEDNVISDVFITDDTYGIYTDLATALDMAVSGDDVEIRDEASTYIILSKSTEVKEGVELTGSDGRFIVVPSGIIFTISGVVEVDAIQVVDYSSTDLEKNLNSIFYFDDMKCQDDPGVLNLNSIDISIDALYIYAGIVNFTSAFDDTDEASSSILGFVIYGTEDNMAIINVEGKYTMDAYMFGLSSLKNSNIQINVPGELTLKSDVDPLFYNYYVILNVTGTVSIDAYVDVNELYATGSAKIVADEDNFLGLLVKGTIGEESGSFEQSINGVEATVGVWKDDAGKYAVLTVYGKASDVVVYAVDSSGDRSDEDVPTTEFYVNRSVLYETIYYGGPAGDKMTLPTLNIEGHMLVAWYKEPTFVTDPITSAEYGEFSVLYASVEIIKFKVNFEFVNNAKWYLDNKLMDTGEQSIDYNKDGYDLDIFAADGYELKDVKILVNGQPISDNYVPAEGDEITFGGKVVEKGEVEGMDLITVLLIIITVVIIIMAIIIALKLLRS